MISLPPNMVLATRLLLRTGTRRGEARRLSTRVCGARKRPASPPGRDHTACKFFPKWRSYYTVVVLVPGQSLP